MSLPVYEDPYPPPTPAYEFPLPHAGGYAIIEIQKAAVLLANLAAAGGLPVAIVSGGGGAGKVQAGSWAAFTTSGTIAAGATSQTVYTSTDFVGTVGGASFPAGASMSWHAAPGNTLAALAYTRSAGTIYIGLVV